MCIAPQGEQSVAPSRSAYAGVEQLKSLVVMAHVAQVLGPRQQMLHSGVMVSTPQLAPPLGGVQRAQVGVEQDVALLGPRWPL